VTERVAASGMTIRRVTSLRDFDDLTETWQQFTRETGQICPFLSHDWFACCWRTAGPNRRREVWVCEDAGRPVAFVPLVHSRVRVLGLPVRVVSFLGTTVTPFVDIPAGGGTDDIASALIAELKSRRDWDVVSLVNLRAASMTAKALMAALPGELRWSASRTATAPYVTISGTWDDFLRSRDGELVAAWRRAEAAIERRGRITLEEHRQVDPDGPIFQDVVEVSHATWPHAGRLATSSGEAESRFLRELTRRASANGWLRLWILRIDGRPIATEYQLGANGSVHAVRADHDPSLRESALGTCLEMRIVQTLFERGDVHEYDLSTAGGDARHLASGRHETVTLEIYAPTAIGALLYQLGMRVASIARRWRAAVMEWHQ
jgi:CelD/BcsL family acetyltransferase involved in cellulose biosynthesis